MAPVSPRQNSVAELSGLPGTSVVGCAENSAGHLKLLLLLILS